MKTLFVYESVNVDVYVHYFLTNRICKIAFIYDIFFFLSAKKKNSLSLCSMQKNILCLYAAYKKHSLSLCSIQKNILCLYAAYKKKIKTLKTLSNLLYCQYFFMISLLKLIFWSLINFSLCK